MKKVQITEATNSLANAIRHYREEKGLSIRDLSKITGISVSYISRLESGEKRRPTVQVVKILSNALEVELYDYIDLNSL